MKDEEMAEEWVRTEHNIPKDCLSACVRAEHKKEIQAFLAGLKAGRPQWHKMEKDSNDLPVNNKEVLIITSDNRKHIGFYNNGWFCQDSGGIVIAWCELPTFDKE